MLFSAAAERVDPFGGLSNSVTDLNVAAGVRYLLPIERPSIDYDKRNLRLRLAVVQEQERQVLRELRQRWDSLAAVYRRNMAALQLLENQRKIVRQQMNEAQKDLRNGRLQFQNFLDHWERYQAVQLRIWDVQRQAWLAAADAIAASGRFPGACRAVLKERQVGRR